VAGHQASGLMRQLVRSPVVARPMKQKTQFSFCPGFSLHEGGAQINLMFLIVSTQLI